MKFSLLCPSRGRPDRFREFARSAVELAFLPGRVDIHLGIDRDDPVYEVYLDEMGDRVIAHVNEEKRSNPQLLQWLLPFAEGDAVLLCADDVVWRTKNWDSFLEAEFRQAGDRPWAVAFNDLSGSQKWTHLGVNRKWIDQVGYLVRTEFEHFCIDEWVERLAKGSGCGRWLPHMMLEHKHKKYRYPDGTPKAPNDATYDMKRRKAADGTSMSDRDNARLRSLLPEIERTARRLRAGADRE